MVSLDLSTTQRYGLYCVAALWVVKNFADNVSKRGHSAKDGVSKAKRRAIDPEAKKHSRFLIKICFESFTSKESFTLYGLIIVLLLRTVLSIVVADVDGHLVKTLINRDKKQVLMGILMWLGIAIPSSFVNALIKYLQSRLSLGLRAKLTAYTREKFFANDTFYHVNQTKMIAGTAGSPTSQGTEEASSSTSPSAAAAEDSIMRALQHPESVLTEDIAAWSDRFSDLMSSIGKPLVDLAFFSALLYHRLGFINQFMASVFVWETGKLLKYIRPDFGEIVQERGNLEADLRSKHTRIIESSEEIAFCHGEQRERESLASIFSRIVNFNQSILNRQILYHTFEDFVTKYLWSAVGMIQVAVPLVKSGTTAGDNAKYFITVRRIMIRNGDAVERVLAGIKDGIEFNGYTMKIVNMLRGFERLAAHKDGAQHPDPFGLCDAELDQPAAPLLALPGDEQFSIIIRDVPLRTPQGEQLVEKLNLALAPGDRLLVLGPNGCGKSSLFRVLCGLWPHEEGYIRKPQSRRDLFFVPQKPYLVVGSFRDQIIYPDTVSDMRVKGVTDEDILHIVETVLMNGPLEAHGGLDSVKEWSEVLSGGEKQRLGLARVFYHKPQYAILDECSSAINVEAEQLIFGALLRANMGLITISHRPTLFPFHNKLLTFDGEGGCQFEPQFKFDELSQRNEKKTALMRRLQRVLKELGEDWPTSVAQALDRR